MPVRLLLLLFLTVGVVSAGYTLGARAECSMASELYPVSATLEEWTTSESLENALPINDDTFRSVGILSGTTRRVLKAPDGVVSLEGFYPAGSYNPTHTPRGGFSFYGPGPEDVDLTTAREATFAYTILFSQGFDWVKGGKIPGICAYTAAFPCHKRKPGTDL
jgi:hypothetical protein